MLSGWVGSSVPMADGPFPRDPAGTWVSTVMGRVAMWLREGKWKSLSRVRLFVTPWTVQSMEFSRPEY